MSDYRHATDRVDGTIVASCSECDEYAVSVEYGAAADNEVLDDLKQIVSDTCPYCSGDVGVVQSETPVEVFE